MVVFLVWFSRLQVVLSPNYSTSFARRARQSAWKNGADRALTLIWIACVPFVTSSTHRQQRAFPVAVTISGVAIGWMPGCTLFQEAPSAVWTTPFSTVQKWFWTFIGFVSWFDFSPKMFYHQSITRFQRGKPTRRTRTTHRRFHSRKFGLAR